MTAALTASVDPDTARVASWLTLTVRLEPTRPINAPAGVKVQLPRSWHVWHRNGAKGVHSIDPALPNYVSVRAPDGLDIRFEIEEGSTAERVVVNTRRGIDGRQHRYNYVARLDLDAGTWQPGTAIEVVFGDQSGGSNGFQAAFHPQGPEPVLVALDEDGDGEYSVLPDQALARLTAEPDEAVELLAVLPSIARTGEACVLHLTALDHLHNPTHWPGDVRLNVVEGSAALPDVARRPEATFLRLPVVPTGSGTVRIEAACGDLSVQSNPCDVATDAPSDRIYWGDLHIHSNESYDATGHHPFEYGRDVMGLDFMALTDHCEEWPADSWPGSLERAEHHLEPGRFVTIPAYEGTFDGPYGHHNVFFRRGAAAGPVIGNDRGTVEDIWRAARRGDVITIPHHTAITWAGNPKLRKNRSQPHVDWTIHDPEFRRLVEVYSSHGQCETYDPAHPLAYENITDFSNATSSEGPNWAQDGWLQACILGTVSGSDNHASQTGRCHTGLTAVLAADLTRDAVFDAMLHRRTYATTGQRILLDFRIGDEQMGGHVSTESPVRGSVRAVGTDGIALVEVLRGDLDGRTLDVHASWQPHSGEIDEQWDDPEPPARGFYYARLRQRNEVHGRAVMAWSSPIWVETAGSSD